MPSISCFQALGNHPINHLDLRWGSSSCHKLDSSLITL